MADILVVAHSARALAQSARSAGYAPLGADFFCDLDLREAAQACVRIEGDLDDGFEWAALVTGLEALAAGRDPVGIVCGSGFEDRPDFLDGLADRWPLLANSAAMVARAKDPNSLAAICAHLAIPHPRWSEEPRNGADWLCKRRGGSGGAHVGMSGGNAASDSYWQERVPGTPVSALLLACGGTAIVLGLSAQWPDPLPAAPFRYGGAVRPAVLPGPVEDELENAARSIVEALQLVGLNSVDFLVAAQSWRLIEVNPRPGATLDIFAPAEASLVGLHVEACRGRLPERAPVLPGAAAAAIVYARRAVDPVADFAWPEWAADRQPPGSRVEANAPLCSVLARAETPEAARGLVEMRAEKIRAAIGAG